MTEEKAADKRVLKTRRAIRDALMEILESKSVHDITIKELAERAGINRKTFYAHYSSPADVIAELEDELVSAMQLFLNESLIGENGIGPQYFFEFVNSIYASNPEFFENLMTVRNYSFLAEKIKNFIRETLLASPHLAEEDRPLISGIVEFATGGLTSLYVSWIKDGKRVPFSTITELALTLTMQGVKPILPLLHAAEESHP